MSSKRTRTSLALAGLLALTLVGCGGKNEEAKPIDNEKFKQGLLNNPSMPESEKQKLRASMDQTGGAQGAAATPGATK